MALVLSRHDRTPVPEAIQSLSPAPGGGRSGYADPFRRAPGGTRTTRAEPFKVGRTLPRQGLVGGVKELLNVVRPVKNGGDLGAVRQVSDMSGGFGRPSSTAASRGCHGIAVKRQNLRDALLWEGTAVAAVAGRALRPQPAIHECPYRGAGVPSIHADFTISPCDSQSPRFVRRIFSEPPLSAFDAFSPISGLPEIGLNTAQVG